MGWLEIHYAKSDVTACRVCHKRLEKGKIRIAFYRSVTADDLFDAAQPSGS